MLSYRTSACYSGWFDELEVLEMRRAEHDALPLPLPPPPPHLRVLLFHEESHVTREVFKVPQLLIMANIPCIFKRASARRAASSTSATSKIFSSCCKKSCFPTSENVRYGADQGQLLWPSRQRTTAGDVVQIEGKHGRALPGLLNRISCESGLCEYVILHTILPPSPVILWI